MSDWGFHVHNYSGIHTPYVQRNLDQNAHSVLTLYLSLQMIERRALNFTVWSSPGLVFSNHTCGQNIQELRTLIGDNMIIPTHVFLDSCQAKYLGAE